MPDFRLMYDKEYLSCMHLQGKEHKATISRVVPGELSNKSGKVKKPILILTGLPPGMPVKYALPISVGTSVIAPAYGFDYEKWIGKDVVLYPSTTPLAGAVVDCIRIKIPK